MSKKELSLEKKKRLASISLEFGMEREIEIECSAKKLIEVAPRILRTVIGTNSV